MTSDDSSSEYDHIDDPLERAILEAGLGDGQEATEEEASDSEPSGGYNNSNPEASSESSIEERLRGARLKADINGTTTTSTDTSIESTEAGGNSSTRSESNAEGEGDPDGRNGESAGGAHSVSGLTDAELTVIKDFKKVTRIVHQEPSYEQYSRLGEHNRQAIQQRFGSWDALLETAAQFDDTPDFSSERNHVRQEEPEENNGEREPSDGDHATKQDVVQDFDRVERIVHQQPTKNQYDNLGHYSLSTIADLFGSWGEFFNREPSTSESATTSGATWSHIPDDERLDQPITLKVTDVQWHPDSATTATLTVEDQTGHEFKLTDWESHSNLSDWEPGVFYQFEQLRGTVWVSDGETHKGLDTTKDSTATKLQLEPTHWHKQGKS